MRYLLEAAEGSQSSVCCYRWVAFAYIRAADFRSYELVIVGMVPIAMAMVFRSRSRLTALAAMGVVGYAVALVFILFGAPDVAVTQFLIETLTVVLFVLVLHKLPPFMFLVKGWERIRGIAISLFFGGVMTCTLLLVLGYDLDSSLKRYFAESSYPLGKGRNIVNVILVDFRGLDTLGEITVLAIASMGILALLRLKLDEKEEGLK